MLPRTQTVEFAANVRRGRDTEQLNGNAGTPHVHRTFEGIQVLLFC
jgi:hypothetical protein